MSSLPSSIANKIAEILQFIAGSSFASNSVNGKQYGSILSSQLCGATIISPDILLLVVLTAAVGVGIYAFIYLLGYILSREEFKVFAKIEILELFFATIALILLFSGILAFMCIPLVGNYTMFDVSIVFLNEVLLLNAVSMWSLQLFYFTLSSLTYANTIISKIFTGIAARPLEGLFTTLQPMFQNSGVVIVFSIVLVGILQYTFEVIIYFFVKYMFPVGLILRAFPLTRRIGGALLGLSLGLLIFLPLMFYIGHVIFTSIAPIYYDINNQNYVYGGSLQEVERLMAPLTTDDRQRIEVFGEYLKSTDYFNMTETTLPQSEKYNQQGKLWFTNILAFLSDLVGGLTANFSWFVGFLFRTVCLGVFFVGIFPIIATMVVTTGVRYLSGLLGQEIDVANLTRLV